MPEHRTIWMGLPNAYNHFARVDVYVPDRDNDIRISISAGDILYIPLRYVDQFIEAVRWAAAGPLTRLAIEAEKPVTTVVNGGESGG